MRFALLCLLPAALLAENPARLSPGDLVKLTRSEMLQFQGKDLAGAAKGQEFSVLKHDTIRRTVFVSFVDKDARLIAVTVPAEAVEFIPPTPWMDLLAGADAFRLGNATFARARLTTAAKDPALAPIAAPLAARITAANLPELRQTAAQLLTLGYPVLALAIDQGTDRLAARTPGATASEIDRAALAPKAADTTRLLLQARQAIGLHRGIAALDFLTDAVALAPGRPDFREMKAKVESAIVEAGERCDDADRMRRFPKGTVHALTAIEMGLKLCADHPRLIALRKNMEAQFEERTSPPVTAAFVKLVRSETSESALKTGRDLYTRRCTECHNLELLDSRSMEGWRGTVAGMARRANLSGPEQTQILDYLAAAKIAVAADP